MLKGDVAVSQHSVVALLNRQREGRQIAARVFGMLRSM